MVFIITWRAVSGSPAILPEATKRIYGVDQPETADFGKRCLLARRLAERGVRFVQVWSGHGGGSGNCVPVDISRFARA